jgi:hypothetical protein
MTESIDEAVAEIEGFYRNYQSERYVDGVLVFRVLRPPPEQELARLADEFSDVLEPPGLSLVEPSAQEVADGDALECRRIAVHFNQRSYGRLRQLIDAINQF